VFSEIEDYKRWAKIEIRFLWIGVNHMLYEMRYGYWLQFSYTLDFMSQLLARNIRRFCMYPWTSIDDADETIRDNDANMHVIDEIFDTQKNGKLKRKKIALFMHDKATDSSVNYLKEIAADDLVAPDETDHTDEQKAITQNINNQLRDILLLWIVIVLVAAPTYMLNVWKEKYPDFWNVVAKHLRPPTTTTTTSRKPNLKMAKDAWKYASRAKIPFSEFEKKSIMFLYLNLHNSDQKISKDDDIAITLSEEESSSSSGSGGGSSNEDYSDDASSSSSSSSSSMTSSEDGLELWNEDEDSRPRIYSKEKHRAFFFQMYPQWAPLNLYDVL
jgi:hypothetical protein